MNHLDRHQITATAIIPGPPDLTAALGLDVDDTVVLTDIPDRGPDDARKNPGTPSNLSIPPKDYDGAADSRAYHRFVMGGEAYLRDGKVHKERQIRILAHYLDGKAYNFYMQKVALDDPNFLGYLMRPSACKNCRLSRRGSERVF